MEKQLAEDPRFGRYTNEVAGIKDYLVGNQKEIAAKRSAEKFRIRYDCDCAEVPADIRTWTKADFRTMAKNPYGFAYFEGLTLFARNALVRNKEGTDLTLDAKQSLTALVEFKPKDMKIVDFINNLFEIDKETRELRARYWKENSEKAEMYKNIKKASTNTGPAQGKIESINLDDLNSIQPIIKDSPIFDQQSALAALDAHKVSLDKESNLKSPEVKAALDFVKAAKGLAA